MEKQTQIKSKDVKKSANYKRDKHREKVKGMFKFYEVPGGTLSFVFKEHKGDQIEKYTMVDGQVYEVPLGVAKHLNKNGWYPVHNYKQDDSGTHMRIGEKVHRFGFQSLDFVDMDEVAPEKELVTVERVI
jgi:hypothetical protein